MKLESLLNYDIVFAKSSNVKSSYTNSLMISSKNNKFMKLYFSLTVDIYDVKRSRVQAKL